MDLIDKHIISRSTSAIRCLPLNSDFYKDIQISGLSAEQVFNLNGLGRLFVESVGNQDFAMTQQLVMLVVIIFVLTNIFVDIFYASQLLICDL